MPKERNYKSLIIALSLSFLILFFIGSCAEESSLTSSNDELERLALRQKVELLEAAGELVFIVGGDTISTDEIINSRIRIGTIYTSPIESLSPVAQSVSLEQFKEQARGNLELALSSKISDILLYQLAKNQAGANINESLEKAAEAELRKFILKFGGDEVKADEALRKMGMNRQRFKEYQKKMMLTQSYVALKFPVNSQITYSELMASYEQMKEEFFAQPTMIEFSLIDIEPEKLKIFDPNKNKVEIAKKLADKLLSQIKAGEDFGKLALAHSHGHRREFEGLWKQINPDSLAKPYDILAAEAQKLEPGQIAGPIETEGHIFIMKLQDKHSKSYEPFEKVQIQVEQKIIADRQRQALDKLNAKVMQRTELEEKDKFIDFCLEKIYQISNQ
jgi:parvulin-like peptidyl-prolyl isomerase